MLQVQQALITLDVWNIWNENPCPSDFDDQLSTAALTFLQNKHPFNHDIVQKSARSQRLGLGYTRITQTNDKTQAKYYLAGVYCTCGSH